ncbi:Aspartyl/glutamyl-tRNA(Asn/Gln) amidotransferase subunit B [Gimesia chilikensis]|uniref:Aspartyl/glutamyl-tRNA(Asn/Gln) amidotransferase subunit B n=1 Tax=Gimesia chilikensis TaxID=2605989 RepID=A0A517W836_9PLAN|nr:Asp-tRNA(Asn)/Glu-tRNA(Gln) amidotransferase subunit GatB [Gimesia chilikensis]QDU01427.1 Aspartyl/glutamyl-tRNA(Asn/Gln) amidotransferase subunit B [Gimesia chilikensis]
MDYTVIIGLEVHVQLQTRTKLFCGCSTKFNPDQPNTQTCPVCLGLPGALPVLNREAFRLGMKTGLAINCEIPSFTKWDRKQYYYPDLPKAYQISQYDLPMSQNGWLEIEIDPETRETKKVGIIRAHLEEDAGKNSHDESGRGQDSKVDLNRCGTPLVEIVSEPDLRSAQEARKYLEELKLLLTYIDVSDCNMQEGSLRCDANVNLHIHQENGDAIATPIVEIKNLNSFRGVEQAIDYEVKRQWEEWQKTGQSIKDVPKETRGWDADRGVTLGQRGKEEAADYRYFPDPDLAPVTVTDAEREEVVNELCERPANRRNRFEADYGLSTYDAAVIIDQGIAFADYFETVAQGCGNGKQAANWVTQDVQRELNERSCQIADFPIRPEVLAALLQKVEASEITIKSARTVFQVLLEEDAASVERIQAVIEEKGLGLVSDTGELEAIVEAVVAKNEKAVADFQSGKQAAVGALIGQVMREIKGADAKVVRELLIKKMS